MAPLDFLFRMMQQNPNWPVPQGGVPPLDLSGAINAGSSNMPGVPVLGPGYQAPNLGLFNIQPDQGAPPAAGMFPAPQGSVPPAAPTGGGVPVVQPNLPNVPPGLMDALGTLFAPQRMAMQALGAQVPNIAAARDPVTAGFLGPLAGLLPATEKPKIQAPAPMSAIPNTFAWPSATPGQGAGATRTMTISPSGAVNTGGQDLTRELIKKREGFIADPKFDVNALRAGYGSDQITLADGTVKPVTPGTRVSVDDAERDLTRRIGEFQGKIKDSIGNDAWAKLTPGAQAALTSVTYNYGRLPERVAGAAKTGDPTQIATAIEGLKDDNEGVNAARRAEEARVAMGGAIYEGSGSAAGGSGSGAARRGDPFAAPNLSAPQLPSYPTIEAQKGVDPAAFDRFNALKVIAPEPLTTSDRVTNMLAAMASGAAGAKNIGDLLLGAGGGAAAGAGRNIAQERADKRHTQEKELELETSKARVGVERARAVAEGQNAQVAARNQMALGQQQVGTQQAQIDAQTQNKMKELQHDLDLKRFQFGLPSVSPTKDGGATIVQRQEDGGAKITTMKGSELDTISDQIKHVTAAFGKDAPVADMMRFELLGKQYGTPLVRREVIKDALPYMANILPEAEYKKLDAEAKKGIPAYLMSQPKEYEKVRLEKLTDLLFAQSPEKLDPILIPYMAKLNNYGAMKLIQGGIAAQQAQPPGGL